MAMSTQRLVIIFFAFNILTGIVSTIYHNPTSTTDGFNIIITEETNTQNAVTTITSDEMKYSGISSGLTLSETTAGNPITASILVWNILTKGFNPIDIRPSQAETIIEEMHQLLLIYFLLGFEHLWH